MIHHDFLRMTLPNPWDRPVDISGDHLPLRSSVPLASQFRPSVMKRPFDIILSSFGLFLSAPLWLMIALTIKLEDSGPVFHGQERVGRWAKRFKS